MIAGEVYVFMIEARLQIQNAFLGANNNEIFRGRERSDLFGMFLINCDLIVIILRH
jgi:hypothetical protein